MFQNQIFQVKCFNLETFEIFQTCPECTVVNAISAMKNGINKEQT